MWRRSISKNEQKCEKVRYSLAQRMKFLRRVLLVLLLIVLVAQIPFVYRRYQLGRLNAKIQE